MALLCETSTIQYSARSQSARLSMHKLFTSCVRRGPVSRDSIIDDAWMPATEYCHRYQPCYLFTVSNLGLLFFHVGQPAGTSAYLVYPISDVERRRKFGELYCTECTVHGVQENDRIDSNGKMETRHPVKG